MFIIVSEVKIKFANQNEIEVPKVTQLLKVWAL